MDFIDTVLLAFIGFLAIPTLLFACQAFLAHAAAGSFIEQTDLRSRVAVLMPAHNEAQVITNTLSSIIPQLEAGDLCLVVADNCTDDTALLASALGVSVIERKDNTRRGKGYALDFGLQFLADNNPPAVVIIIDADCQVSPSCIDTLARRAASENRPIQALYLMQAPTNKSVTQAIAEFAWQVKNHVRPLGFMRLGLPCQLMGTGMAFPWLVLRQADLAHGNMVEDMKLGIDLALQGFAPAFCPNALVTSEFPASAQATNNQRKRWEHGHLATILAEAPRLLISAIQKREPGLLAMGLDLAIPPLSMLALSLGVMLNLTFILAFFMGNPAPFALMTSLFSIFAMAVFSAWYRFGRELLSFKILCSAPFYILRKLPLYFAFLIKRQQDWVKTERH